MKVDHVVAQLRGTRPPRDVTFDGQTLMCRMPLCPDAKEIFRDALRLQPEFVISGRIRATKVRGGTEVRLSVRARHDPSRKLKPS